MKKLMIFTVFLIVGGAAHAQRLNLMKKKNEGIFNITQIGYLSGMGNISYDGDLKVNESQTYRIRTMFGYFISPRFSFALGAGADAYQNPSYNTLPVFADVRGYLHDARNSPYVFIDLGNSFPIGPEFEEGMFLNFGAGFKYFVSERMCLNTSIGYNYQRMHPEKLYYNDLWSIGYRLERPSNFKALSIHVGIIFQLWSFRRPGTDLFEE